MRQAQRGFTLIELLVVVSIIALLMSIMLPSLGRAKEMANRVHCASNLRSITQLFILYGNENNDEYPVSVGPVYGNGEPPPYRYTAGTNHSALSSLTSLDLMYSYVLNNSSHQGDAFSPFFLLAGMGNQTKLFLCKSDRIAGAPAAVRDGTLYYDGFQSYTQISYSVVYPWASSSRGPWWRNTMDSNRPVASDMAPFSDGNYKDPSKGTGKIANSDNHEGAGQNVSFADNHVQWSQNPKVGPLDDNIFTLKKSGSTTDTAGISTAGQLPADASTVGAPSLDDYIMVPTRDTSNYSIK